MEEEIPLGLEIIGKGVEQDASGGYRFEMRRIVFSSILRLGVGYLFLLCLFLTVVQETNVLGIFFDVLALEFVENVDDVVFELSKRGFFGRSLRKATKRKHYFEDSGKRTHALKKWVKRFIRFVYCFNAGAMIGGLTWVMIKQDFGDYRCKSITVEFGDDYWEEAFVKLENSTLEKRVLIYSHFNGIYKENGTHDGRPKYTEQNKEDGDPFLRTLGAEIIYCQDLESWVFRHEHIKTSPDEDLEVSR